MKAVCEVCGKSEPDSGDADAVIEQSESLHVCADCLKDRRAPEAAE